MGNIRLFLLLLICSNSYGQIKNVSFVSLTILNDTLVSVSRNAQLSLSLNFTNNSGGNVLLYGLNGSVSILPFSPTDVCNSDITGTGIVLMVFDSTGLQKRAKIRISDEIEFKPMPFQRVDSIFQITKQRFLKDNIIFKTNDQRSYKKEFNLKDFNLKKGTYFIQVIYYCGKRVYDFVDKKQVNVFLKSNNADLFQGCAISNKIALVIK